MNKYFPKVRTESIGYIACYSCFLDVPYPPTMLQMDSGQCHSLNVTWGPPTREALGGPVTGYLTQIKERDSKDTWHNCSSPDVPRSTFCMFTSLKRDTFYNVRVMAKNGVGYGLPSHKTVKTENTGNYKTDLSLQK